MKNKSWHDLYTPPPVEEINRVGSKDWSVFIEHADVITPTIVDALLPPLKKLDNAQVLDFGCGVGRVALKLYAEHKFPTHACDVNAEAIAYLSKQLPATDCQQTNYDPPLPYPDAFFDAVYSVSVWTHLPADKQDIWLKEMARILKPGGVALLTTSGHAALKARHERGDAGWSETTSDDLIQRGFIYREYDRYAVNPGAYPGITSSYGLTAHDEGYVRNHWSRFLEVLDFKAAAIANVQDLAICARPRHPILYSIKSKLKALIE